MYRKILAVVERGAVSARVVREAVGLAKVHEAEVILLTLLPRYASGAALGTLAAPDPAAFQREAMTTASRLLAAAAVVAGKAGVRSRSVTATGADDAQAIYQQARKRACGLIVVGSTGRNAVLRLLGGSVVPGLITVSDIPVLVVRDRKASPSRHKGGDRAATPRSRGAKSPAGTRRAS